MLHAEVSISSCVLLLPCIVLLYVRTEKVVERTSINWLSVKLTVPWHSIADHSKMRSPRQASMKCYLNNSELIMKNA